MRYGLAFNNKRLAAVLTNGAANCLRCVIYRIPLADNSVTGGASLGVAGQVACCGIAVNADSLATSLNRTDTVAVGRSIVVANVVANSTAVVTNCISVIIDMRSGLGSAAEQTYLRVAKAVPIVLLLSLISATVIADLIASGRVEVLIVGSHVSAGAAGGAATKLIVVLLSGNHSLAAAMGAAYRALKLIRVLGRAGRIAVCTNGGARVEPCVDELALGSLLAANVTVNVTAVGVSVGNAGSGLSANAAGGGAIGSIGVLQRGACRLTNVADGIAIVRVGVLQRLKLGSASGTNGAVAGFARVLHSGLSLNRHGAAVAERIAIGRIIVIHGAKASREREERQRHTQK